MLKWLKEKVKMQLPTEIVQLYYYDQVQEE